MNKSTETPKRTEALLDAYKAEEEIKTVLDPKAIKKSTLESLPTPTGYRLLVLPYAGPKKTKGGKAKKPSMCNYSLTWRARSREPHIFLCVSLAFQIRFPFSPLYFA